MQKKVKAIIPQLNPSQFDNYLFDESISPKNGLYDKFHIEEISFYKKHIKIPVKPHRRSVYFFLFITKGSAIRSKGLTQYSVSEHDFFCLPANQITSIEYLSEDIEGYYCHFDPDIFNMPQLKINIEKDFSFFGYNAVPIIQKVDFKKVLPILNILFAEYKINLQSRKDLIPLYLTLLFKEITLTNSQSNSEVVNASSQLTQKYKNALSHYIYQKKTVHEYADLLAVSPNHLHKSVKKATGKSAHNLLDEMRILEAKVLLHQTELTIAEIAFKIGDFAPTDFSRFFKKHTNLTPKQYRIISI